MSEGFCQKHAQNDQCGRAAERWLYGDDDYYRGRYEPRSWRYGTRQVDNREEYYRDHMADDYRRRDANAGSVAGGLNTGVHCDKDHKTCGSDSD